MTATYARILVIDDEPALARTLVAIFQLSGYTASAVQSAEEALTSIAACQPSLVVSDVMAFTMEWGLGQVLPVKKDMSQLLQLGLIGYDQWQVSNNGGTVTLAPSLVVPASLVPSYSSHGIGVQSNFILPAKNLVFFFKYLDAYRALASVKGRTFVFGFSWTLKIPKTQAPKS